MSDTSLIRLLRVFRRPLLSRHCSVSAVDSSSEPAAESESETEGETDQIAPELAGPSIHIVELHEVRTINAGLKDLAEFMFDIGSLMPEERTGTEDPRYVLRRGDAEREIEDLRGLLGAVRAAGEKGLQVTRSTNGT